jgi:hypothetical protein
VRPDTQVPAETDADTSRICTQRLRQYEQGLHAASASVSVEHVSFRGKTIAGSESVRKRRNKFNK